MSFPQPDPVQATLVQLNNQLTQLVGAVNRGLNGAASHDQRTHLPPPIAKELTLLRETIATWGNNVCQSIGSLCEAVNRVADAVPSGDE